MHWSRAPSSQLGRNDRLQEGDFGFLHFLVDNHIVPHQPGGNVLQAGVPLLLQVGRVVVVDDVGVGQVLAVELVVQRVLVVGRLGQVGG